MTSETAVLDRCPFFEQFQPKHLDKLMMLGTPVHFGEGDIIFREGDEAPQFYVLLSGRVALEANFGGRQVRIDTLFVGDELGWSAVLTHLLHHVGGSCSFPAGCNFENGLVTRFLSARAGLEVSSAWAQRGWQGDAASL